MSITCDRCKKQTNSHITSMFNTQEICDECKREERNHPDYYKALDADNEQIKNENYNFEGIGLPNDLAQKYIS